MQAEPERITGPERILGPERIAGTWGRKRSLRKIAEILRKMQSKSFNRAAIGPMNE